MFNVGDRILWEKHPGVIIESEYDKRPYIRVRLDSTRFGQLEYWAIEHELEHENVVDEALSFFS